MAASSNGNGLLYFIVGALCATAAVCVVVIMGGLPGGGSTIQGPSQAQAPAAAPAAPTRNITIEKKIIETPEVIQRERH